jgi:hypothetical protein
MSPLAGFPAGLSRAGILAVDRFGAAGVGRSAGVKPVIHRIETRGGWRFYCWR